MRPHDKLIREQFFPEARRFEGEAFERAYRQRPITSRQRQPDRRAGAGNGIDLEGSATQQIDPPVPGIEVEVCTIEEAAVLLRKAAEQDVPAEVRMAAVGQRRDERAAFGECVAAVFQEDERIAKVLEDVGAEDVVEAAAQRRKTVV